jgi:NAD(P) transhydrogenase subunit beta
VETYLGILIGAVTFTGSVIAFGKLSARISGKPLTLPARHWLNLGLLIASVWLCFVRRPVSRRRGMLRCSIIMTIIALLFGVHMVMAIGGADMPVVVSMLNSYSGWAAAATGFMLSNDLLIVTGALVGSSGAILSYIMCRAMNRKFLASSPAASVRRRVRQRRRPKRAGRSHFPLRRETRSCCSKTPRRS